MSVDQNAAVAEESSSRNPEAEPARCPRHARKVESGPKDVGKWIQKHDLWREPFRLFFPAAVLAGLVGVAVWPIVLLGWTENFPNVIHTRLMVMGFYGGFIFGFLGTSFPRLIENRPFAAWETIPLLVVHLGVIAAFSVNAIQWGDRLFAGNVLPPPSFLMVVPGACCLLIGIGLAELGRREPLESQMELLFRLLTYHGFILLCLLGAGGFLLPRFLGLGVRRKLGENRQPTAAWLRGSVVTLGSGFSIAATFWLDAHDYTRLGATMRTFLVVGYLFWEMPLERLRFSMRGVNWILASGLFCIPIGILAGGWFPAMRAGMAHIELIGGFGLITMGVATRVVFGHSGNRHHLERVHPWITTSAVFILLGVSSRIIGDVLPQLMISHYIYGALCWLIGLIIWSTCVLPKVLKPDPEG